LKPSSFRYPFGPPIDLRTKSLSTQFLTPNVENLLPTYVNYIIELNLRLGS
jgi:hypothetical protein